MALGSTWVLPECLVFDSELCADSLLLYWLAIWARSSAACSSLALEAAVGSIKVDRDLAAAVAVVSLIVVIVAPPLPEPCI